MKKKSVLLRAYLNHNLGDDLFVYTICNRYPNTHFYIIGTKDNSHNLKNISNLTYWSEDSFWFKLLNKGYKIDCKLRHKPVCNIRNIVFTNMLCRFFKYNVLISGSYFTQPAYWTVNDDNTWYSHHPYILGCNFGPYKTPEYLEYHKEKFKLATQVCFRDEFSYNMFSDIDVVEQSTDIVFNLPVESINDNGEIVISVVNLNKDDSQINKYSDMYIDKVALLVNHLLANNKSVRLMSFCDHQGDLDVIFTILSKVDKPDSVLVSSYEKDGLVRSLEILRNCHSIIATRYHAMILGLLFNKEVFPIVYDKKIIQVIESIGYTGKYVTVSNLDSFNPCDIDDYFYKMDSSKLNDCIIEAKKQFRLLDVELN